MTHLDLNEDQTQELLSFTKELARNAGKMIREAFSKPRTSDYQRKSATDPVTETDKAVEQYIYNCISEKFPTHRFIGEESASDEQWTDQPTWIIDPIDGTANFIHRIPMCATSIGFTINRRFIIGVIYNPILDELFEATHLSSSKLNDTIIHVSSVDKLTNACISTECGSNRSQEKTQWVLCHLESVLKQSAQCIRMLGSCALNMANLACGRCDVLYEAGPYAWDMAAGALIIRQAGGIIRSGGLSQDDDFELNGRTLFAYTPSLKQSLDECFRTYENAKRICEM